MVLLLLVLLVSILGVFEEVAGRYERCRFFGGLALRSRLDVRGELFLSGGLLLGGLEQHFPFEVFFLFGEFLLFDLFLAGFNFIE